jgi:hypothetical protein
MTDGDEMRVCICCSLIVLLVTVRVCLHPSLRVVPLSCRCGTQANATLTELNIGHQDPPGIGAAGEAALVAALQVRHVPIDRSMAPQPFSPMMMTAIWMEEIMVRSGYRSKGG